MSKTVKRSFHVMILLLMISCVNAYSWNFDKRPDHQKDRPMHGKEHFREIAKEMNLTEEQSNKLEEFKKQHREEVEKNIEAIAQKRDLVRVELEKENVDIAKIKQIHNEVKDLVLIEEDLRLDMILKMREILTPDQVKIMKDHMSSKKRDGHGKKGKRFEKGEHIRGNEKGAKIIEILSEDKSLTDQQIVSVLRIINKEIQQTKKLKNDIEQQRKEQQQLIEQSKENIAKETEGELSEYLTEEQLEKLRDLKEGRRGQREHRGMLGHGEERF